MAKPIPSYLRIHQDDAATTGVASVGAEQRAVQHGVTLALPDGLAALFDSFTAATGWPLRYAAGSQSADNLDLMWSAPVNPGVGDSPGHLRIDLGTAKNVATLAARVPLEAAEKLASSLAVLLGQYFALRRSLCEREADLAAGVPVAAHPDEMQHLADRLASAIKAGADSIGCQSGALYLLDEGTSELKLRSSFGLPIERLSQPARPLASALADLEALLGHAVALESATTYRPWNVPEPSAAALCVPVSSPTMPLGTLWFFCDSARDFTNEQTNLAEVIAGRLASELDRSMLLTEQVESVGAQRELDAAQRVQQHSLPQIAPKIDGWEIAGYSEQAGQLGGAFHEWRLLHDNRLAIAVADACDGGLVAALAASVVRTAWRCEVDASVAPGLLLRRLNESLGAASAGEQWAGICTLMIDPTSGRLDLGSAGRPQAIILHEDGPELLLRGTTPLGIDPNGLFPIAKTELKIGETLIAFTRGFVETKSKNGKPLNIQQLADVLQSQRTAGTNELVRILCDWQELHATRPNQFDQSAVVVRRRGR